MIQFNKHTRHKLYWIDYSDPVKSVVDSILREADLRVLDLGHEFASFIKDKEEGQVRVMATDYLSEVLEMDLNQDINNNLPFVIIKNIGIMFEIFLDIDVERFLKDFSRNTGVVLLWEGPVKDNCHFLWPNSEDYSMKFNDTTIQKIVLEQ